MKSLLGESEGFPPRKILKSRLIFVQSGAILGVILLCFVQQCHINLLISPIFLTTFFR